MGIQSYRDSPSVLRQDVEGDGRSMTGLGEVDTDDLGIGAGDSGGELPFQSRENHGDKSTTSTSIVPISAGPMLAPPNDYLLGDMKLYARVQGLLRVNDASSTASIVLRTKTFTGTDENIATITTQSTTFVFVQSGWINLAATLANPDAHFSFNPHVKTDNTSHEAHARSVATEIVLGRPA